MDDDDHDDDDDDDDGDDEASDHDDGYCGGGGEDNLFVRTSSEYPPLCLSIVVLFPYAAHQIRLAYPNCARLCIEDDAALQVYHFMDNPRLMHMEGEADDDDDEGGDGDAGVSKEPSGVLRFSMDHACAIEVRREARPFRPSPYPGSSCAVAPIHQHLFDGIAVLLISDDRL